MLKFGKIHIKLCLTIEVQSNAVEIVKLFDSHGIHDGGFLPSHDGDFFFRIKTTNKTCIIFSYKPSLDLFMPNLRRHNCEYSNLKGRIRR